MSMTSFVIRDESGFRFLKLYRQWNPSSNEPSGGDGPKRGSVRELFRFIWKKSNAALQLSAMPPDMVYL
jgi:hypothetical protein